MSPFDLGRALIHIDRPVAHFIYRNTEKLTPTSTHPVDVDYTYLLLLMIQRITARSVPITT